MKIYISGAITNNPNYIEQFNEAENVLKSLGHKVINPVALNAFPFNYQEFMQICFKLIDLSDGIYMLNGWENSKGANAELSYANALGKNVYYQV
jgi:nucleoside 2-deoxyribosyltransferase